MNETTNQLEKLTSEVTKIFLIRSHMMLTEIEELLQNHKAYPLPAYQRKNIISHIETVINTGITLYEVMQRKWNFN